MKINFHLSLTCGYSTYWVFVQKKRPCTMFCVGSLLKVLLQRVDGNTNTGFLAHGSIEENMNEITATCKPCGYDVMAIVTDIV